MVPGQAPPGQLVQAETQLRRGHPRQRQQRRRKCGQTQGGKRMMAYPEVAAAAVGKGNTGDIDRCSPEGADAIDMIARLHSAETQAAPGADAAGPGAEHDNVGPYQAAAGGKGRIDIYRLKCAAKSMPAGDGAAEQASFLQAGNGAAETEGQSRSVRHDTGNPAGGPVVLQNRHGGCNHAVQLSDEHRRLPEAGETGQLCPVPGLALLAAEHAHLPGRIVELHDMAAALEGKRRAAEIVLHKMIAPAAQRQMERCRIQQEPVAAFHRAGNTIVIQGRILTALDEHRELRDGAPPRLDLACPANLTTDHWSMIPPLLIFAAADGNPCPYRENHPRGIFIFPGSGPGNRGGAEAVCPR